MEILHCICLNSAKDKLYQHFSGWYGGFDFAATSNLHKKTSLCLVAKIGNAPREKKLHSNMNLGIWQRSPYTKNKHKVPLLACSWHTNLGASKESRFYFMIPLLYTIILYASLAVLYNYCHIAQCQPYIQVKLLQFSPIVFLKLQLPTIIIQAN